RRRIAGGGGTAQLERAGYGRGPPGRPDAGRPRRGRRRHGGAHPARRRDEGGGVVTAGVAAFARLSGVRSGEAEAMAVRAAERGTIVLAAGDPAFPIDDGVPHAPAVLLLEGDRPEVLRAPRVAVVGTRAASVHGLADAWELGAFLGAAGVSVVSGLAIGIDGAVHHGALQAAEAARQGTGTGPAGGAGPIGVVATGLDIVYPRRHRALFERVRRYGVLVSEQA